MRLMISGATTTLEKFAKDPVMAKYLGLMVTPNTGNDIDRMLATGLPWCVDNACFPDERFDPHGFLALCYEVHKRLDSHPRKFVNVPDYVKLVTDKKTGKKFPVGDHAKTLERFRLWWPVLTAAFGTDMPWSFVLQDGISEPDEIPWNCISALFIGGSNDMKDADITQWCMEEARARGKYVHMGRVNGRKRLWYAQQSYIDSVDGSSLSMFSETWIPEFVQNMRRVELEMVVQDRYCEAMEADIAHLEREQPLQKAV